MEEIRKEKQRGGTPRSGVGTSFVTETITRTDCLRLCFHLGKFNNKTNFSALTTRERVLELYPIGNGEAANTVEREREV